MRSWVPVPRALLVAVLVLALVLAACSGEDEDEAIASEATDAAAVTIRTFNFAPDPIRVTVGETVRFRNLDKINHTVTAGTRVHPKPDEFDGLLSGAGETFDLSFDEPGTYDYFCSFHPGEGMSGQIVVE